MNNIQDLIVAKLGVETTYNINPIVSQLVDSSTLFLKPNPRRIGFIFINLGDVSCYILPHALVSSSMGIICTANGGGKSFIYSEDFMLPSYEWYGVASAACNCLTIEIVMI